MDIFTLSKQGCNNRIVFRNLDLNEVFRLRDKDWFAEHEYYVYLWKLFSKVHYIGKGKGNRFDDHKGDMLEKTIDDRWICEIIAWGLTNKEARMLEAMLIKIACEERNLSRRGTYLWDGKSLINKRRELTYKGVSYEVLFEEYLNLDNGNNYWETFRREVNGY